MFDRLNSIIAILFFFYKLNIIGYNILDNRSKFRYNNSGDEYEITRIN